MNCTFKILFQIDEQDFNNNFLKNPISSDSYKIQINEIFLSLSHYHFE